MSGAAEAPAGGPLADLRAALDRATSLPLVAFVGALFLALLLGVVALHLRALEPPSGGRIDVGTGDFLAFWTGAVAVHEGHGAALYDFASQRALQARILGGASPDFQGYLNPPLLAVALSPAVRLGYLGGFFAFSGACALALALAIAWMARLVPTVRALRGGAWALVFLVASWQPVLQTTLGGQNTPLTLALLVGFALAMQRRRTAWAALALGLLSYKPQYAVGLGVAAVMAGQWRVASGAALVGAAHWALGAAVCGPLWPRDMLAFMDTYRPLELAANAGTHFSLVRTAGYLLPSPADGIVSAAGVALVLALWWRFRRLGRDGDRLWSALAVCGTMLASPHQQYYDVAILVLPVAILVDEALARDGGVPLGARVALALAYVGYPAWAWYATLGVQPLFFVLAAVAWWVVRACARADADGAQRWKREDAAQATA